MSLSVVLAGKEADSEAEAQGEDWPSVTGRATQPLLLQFQFWTSSKCPDQRERLMYSKEGVTGIRNNPVL